ncbi:hypothetical protein [Micromonospora sp. NPDC004704]
MTVGAHAPTWSAPRLGAGRGTRLAGNLATLLIAAALTVGGAFGYERRNLRG